MWQYSHIPRALPDELGQHRVHAELSRPGGGSELQQFPRLRFQNGQHVADAFEVVDLELFVGRERAFLGFFASSCMRSRSSSLNSSFKIARATLGVNSPFRRIETHQIAASVVCGSRAVFINPF